MLNFPKWKVLLILSVLVAGIYYALPNFVPMDGINDKKLNLGLDLRGGSHLLLEVDFDTYLTEQYENQLDAIRKILREAKLGYKDLNADNNDITFNLREIDKAEEAKKLILDSSPFFIVVNNGANFRIKFTDTYIYQRKDELVKQSIEIIRRRVDETGTKEPIIQKQGDQRIVLQVPGEENPDEIKEKINTTAKLTFHMVVGDSSVAKNAVPAPGNVILPDQEGQFWEVEKRAMLGGENLDNASQGYDSYGNVAVMFKFDTVGGKIFGDVTKANVGKRFASVLDGVVISAPVIREAILGGSGQITGNFAVKEANDLATLLRAGALPAALEIMEERTVGASLGADSIAAGKMASIIAIIVVAVFMILTYGVFGVISVISLTLNIILVIAALSLFQATLTLPGIAGIVLTVGMAVDANVLIFERIREELLLGKSPLNAVEQGFEKAFGTILDSNITTLIVGVLLFSFGSGPVKGFAVTLSIGIICSMFTAIMVSRLMIAKWLRKTRPK
ncbi:MAG: protein translocase subunit SecD, partial [Alphaproteobacteria bacterium CG11_big_fil_rev_8_21_14_0_20_44_7]